MQDVPFYIAVSVKYLSGSSIADIGEAQHYILCEIKLRNENGSALVSSLHKSVPLILLSCCYSDQKHSDHFLLQFDSRCMDPYSGDSS